PRTQRTQRESCWSQWLLREAQLRHRSTAAVPALLADEVGIERVHAATRVRRHPNAAAAAVAQCRVANQILWRHRGFEGLGRSQRLTRGAASDAEPKTAEG